MRRIQRKKTRDTESEENSEMDKLININLPRQKHNHKYKALQSDYKITFNDVDAVSFSETLELVERLLDRILTRILGNVEPHHKVRLVLRSPELDETIQIPFQAKQDLNARGVIDYVVRCLNSNENFHLHSGVLINVIQVAVPMGGRGKKVNSFNAKKIVKDKRSIVGIKSKDDLCFGRALAVAKCHALKLNNDREAVAKYDCIRRYNTPQKEAAEALYDGAGVPRGPCGIPEIEKFQQYLGEDFGINVYELNHRAGDQHVYRGYTSAPMQLYICY